MRMLRHLAGHDVYRLRFALVVWLVLIAAVTVVDGARPMLAGDRGVREAVAILGSVLWLAKLLIGFALVSFVIHNHPAVGTDAFWMTRPVPPRLLALSKILLVAAVLVVVPATAEAVLLAAYRVPSDIAAGVVAQRLEFQLVIAAILSIAAVLTRNLGTYALLCAAGLTTIAVSIAIAIAIMTARLSDDPFIGSEGGVDEPAGALIFNILFVAAALLALVVQYRTRLRTRSIVAGVIGVTIAYIVEATWPVPFLSPRLLLPDEAREAGALTLRVDPATISTRSAQAFFPGHDTQWSTVNGQVGIAELPTGWSAAIRVREASLQFAGGETLSSAPGMFGSVLVGDSGDRVPSSVVRDVLGVTRVGSAVPPTVEQPPHYPVLFRLRREQLANRAPARGEYRAQIDIWLTHHVIDGVVALDVGRVHRNMGYGLAIQSISRSNGELAIIARESRASSVWQRRPWGQYNFYLRNRMRAEALTMSDYDLHGQLTFASFLPFSGVSVGSAYGNGFFTRALVITVPPRYDARAQTLIADDAWLADAELVIVRTTQEGMVTRALHVSEFPLGTIP